MRHSGRCKIGEFSDMRVIQRGLSARLVSTEVIGSTGRATVRALRLRTLLSLRDSRFSIRRRAQRSSSASENAFNCPRTLTDDILKSSEIEGEKLDADQVRSSVARRLGMDIGGLKHADRHVEGVVEMMLDATQRYNQRLTQERLFAWHASLFPSGRSGMHQIRVGTWRDDSVVRCRWCPVQWDASACISRHPPAGRLEQEMRLFLDWFNGNVTTESVLKAAKAHLWFVTIHPFAGVERLEHALAIADLPGQISRKSSSLRGTTSPAVRIPCSVTNERSDAVRTGDRTSRG